MIYPSSNMILRDYQERGAEDARQAFREGHRGVILCGPTGSGKTYEAAYLALSAADKGRKVAFVSDLLTLVEQNSRRFNEWRIPHGILQAGRSYRPLHHKITICSAQTLEARLPDLPDANSDQFVLLALKSLVESFDFFIFEEGHILRTKLLDIVKGLGKHYVALSATPFTKGLGKYYTKVICTTTYHDLLTKGLLAPLEVHVARRSDMSDALLNSAGEYTAATCEDKGREIIGDVVPTWIELTNQYFGGPVKTIVFSATVQHGKELCAAFNAAGFKFEQISYLDRDRDARRNKMKRLHDGEITGLVSVDALARGYDEESLLCGIDCRELRRSFMAHIQKLGRVMRAFEGKKFALWIDHTQNYLGFFNEMQEFFQNGIQELDDGEKAKTTRQEDIEFQPAKCAKCGRVFNPGENRAICPSCGFERPDRSRITETPGFMVEAVGVGATGTTDAKKEKDQLLDESWTWGQIQIYAAGKKDGPKDARKLALALYRNWWGHWPQGNYHQKEGAIDGRVINKIKSILIAWAKAREKNANNL